MREYEYQIWGKEEGDTELMFLMAFPREDWAVSAKATLEKQGVRDVEIRTVTHEAEDVGS